MNIFVLHLTPRKCAVYHANKHVVKMILESAQLLCTCWHVIDPSGDMFKPPMKRTHYNHPCAKWARESTANYQWLAELAICLCEEYTHRYNKTHATEAKIRLLAQNVPPIDCAHFTPPAQAMPDEFKVENDAVQAYRAYYAKDKSHLHSWKGREVPPFIANVCSR
jgi:hypothetical protein